VPTTTLDYAPLAAPLDRAAAASLAAQLRATGPTGRKFVGMGVAVDVIGAIGFGAVVLVMLPITISGLVTYVQHPDRIDLSFPAITLATLLGSLGMVWWLLHRYLRRTGSPEIWWRLDSFARANGMVFAPWSPEPAFPAALFSAGAGTATYNHVRREGDDFVNIGNLYFQTGRRSMESFEQRWGFVAILLTEPRPLMLLDARRNNRLGMNGLRTAVGSARLSLPWLSDTFVLKAEDSDSESAREVFSEPLISALTNARGVYDVLVQDRWLFLFSRGEFDMTDAALLAELFGIVDIVRAAKL